MSQLNWKLNTEVDKDLVKDLGGDLPYSDLFLELCLSRGLDTVEAIQSFTAKDPSQFHDPSSLYEIDKAGNRIFKAVEAGEKILIYGDYDADGVTSTAILYECLLTLGGLVTYYIPDRFNDGYGPNADRYQEFIDQGIDLIITVDNGVAGHEAVDLAMSQGVDVIISDHHGLPDQLPDALAVVHPAHPQGDYPFQDLAGAGVALKLSQYLLGEVPQEMLDLAAIGTVADMVSLTGENRTLVQFGLDQLKESQRLGLRRLITDLAIPFSEIDEETISFKLAPVLNAVGRLEDANQVVELLTSFEEERVASLSQHFIQVNEDRKTLVKESVAEALTSLNPNDHIHIVKADHWHQGVLGIMASRIVNETGKPAIVLKEFKNQGIVKGSARSVENFDLFAACSEVRELFVSFGGHQMAAGMTLETNRLDELRDFLNQRLAQLKEEIDIRPSLTIDGEISPDQVTLATIRELNLLKPFGQDNPKPQFILKNPPIKEVRRIGQDKSHLKLILDDQDRKLEGIGFSLGHLADFLDSKAQCQLVANLDKNVWQNQAKAQLMIQDIRLLSARIIDKRTNQLKKSLFTRTKASYICFNQAIASQVKPYLPSQAQLLTAQEVEAGQSLLEEVYLVDCPQSLGQFKELLPQISDKQVVLYFFKPSSLYFNGLPQTEDFNRVYKYLIGHKSLPLDQAQSRLPNYLQMTSVTFNLVIQVFLEVNFVKIESGRLLFEGSHQKIDLEATSTYQSMQAAMEAEEALLFSPKDQVRSYFDAELNKE